jgi:hypothetical protein
MTRRQRLVVFAAWLGTRGVFLVGMAVVFLVARLFAYARKHKLWLVY